MTSISQSAFPPQAPSNAQQSVVPATSGPAQPQAAGTASTGKTSYASATKKTFSPQSASGNSTPAAAASGSGPAQHGKSETSSPVNGRVISPAVPVVGLPNIANGNTPPNSTSGLGDHNRKPSVTISAAGTSGYLPNGTPVSGKPGNGIQFGSMKPDGSPGATNSIPYNSQSTTSLAVSTASNPGITPSASPIPQPPAASGGSRPPSMHNPSLSFGNFGNADANMRTPGAPQGPLAPGPQSSHLRRESSQSQHSDMNNHGMGPPGGRGGYPMQGARGRGYGGSYQQQGQFSPGPQYRQAPSQQRSGPNMGPHPQQNRGLTPFQNSPHQAARSPAQQQSQPAHPHPGQVPMPSPHMGQQQYGAYPNQYGQYPSPNMGPPQGQYVPQGFDANWVSQYYHFYGGLPPGTLPPGTMPPGMNLPPGSPRPMPPGPQQPYFSGQYGNQPPTQNMSRTNSAISGTDRPASGMGKPQPAAPTPSSNNSAAVSRQASSPAPTAKSFQIPQKKSAGVVIKNPNSGEVVAFDKKPSTSPAPSNQSPANVSMVSTPPPPASSHTEAHHSRTESKNVKTDAEKRAEMREAIAKKMEADKAEEQRKKEDEESKAALDTKDAEAKLLKEKAEADAKKLEAAKVQTEAEEAAKKAKVDAEGAEKASAKAKEGADEADKKAREAQEIEEEQIARWEAEELEKERQEQEKEERYQKKKQAEREEAARKEAAAAAMADEEMKKAEAEADAAEEARLKGKGNNEGQESQKEREDMFTALKKDGSAAPSSEIATDGEALADSVIAKPASEIPVPLSKGAATGGKQKPAALKLETSKPVDPAQPTPQLVSLRSARRLTSIPNWLYPPAISSPNPALNTQAPMGKFKYDREFLMQFKSVFTQAPSVTWDQKIQETVGDTTEPSSARATSARGNGPGASMMAGRQSSNRAPLPPQMGAFGQGGRTLPPGTTSQSRYEMSTAGRNAPPPRATMQNPLAGFVSRPGAFPQPAQGIKMDRSPSSTSLAHPNSPRNPSQRGGSQRGSRAAGRREDPKDNKNMPLTAGANLEPIRVSATGWKPPSVRNATGMAGPAPGGDGLLAPDVVQRKVKSNLNKLTPDNFDKITTQILAIAHQSKDETDGRSLRQVIQLTFEKATDEAHWAEMYAQFCKRMLESMSSEIKDENILDKNGKVVVGGALFRKYLLTRCQSEFERGWKMNLPEKPEGETEEAAMLSDTYYVAAAAKRRGLGLVRFIGELYKLGMLTERIMHECVKKLVDYEGIPDEAEVESLTSLLKTIGGQLDSTEKGHPMMDIYFTRITTMSLLPNLPSRLKFMLMDIIDLRKANWRGKAGVLKGPTTLDEVRAQVAEADRLKDVQRAQDNSRRGGGGGGGNRPQMGRGDARNFSGGGQYGQQMPPPNQVGMEDLRRLGSRGNRQVSSQGPTFGPTSMFSNPRGSNSRKPLTLAQRDDSGASSRTGTPPAQKEKKEKEEKEAAKSANTFSALEGLESSEAPETVSPTVSPPTTKAQPREIPSSKEPAGEKDEKKESETS